MPAEVLDFYIVVYAQFTSKSEVWLVYKGECTTSCCVGSYGDRDQATERAIAMARYHAAGGQPTEVHVQADPASPKRWQTIWRSSAPDA